MTAPVDPGQVYPYAELTGPGGLKATLSGGRVAVDEQLIQDVAKAIHNAAVRSELPENVPPNVYSSATDAA